MKKVLVEFVVTGERPRVDQVLQGNGLTVNLQRARVTPREAWLQLEVAGSAKAVDDFVRHRKNEFLIVA